MKSTNKQSPNFQKPKLSQEFVLKIIDLQQKCRKTNSEEYILQLVKAYTKVIEFYNSIHDNMAIYFTEKMQILLASQKTIDIIDKTQEIRTSSMAVTDAMQGLDEFKDNKQKIHQQTKYDLESKKKERSKVVKMFIEIKKTKKRAGAAQILNHYYKQCLQNNNLVNTELEKQNKDLEQRLKSIFQNSKLSKHDTTSQKTQNDSTIESIYIN